MVPEFLSRSSWHILKTAGSIANVCIVSNDALDVPQQLQYCVLKSGKLDNPRSGR
jgi:hypothetical protein